jgi:hypothetical protein
VAVAVLGVRADVAAVPGGAVPGVVAEAAGVAGVVRRSRR